jgi:undecaprenyl-diphosphatase
MLSWLEHLDHQLFFLLNQGFSTPLLDSLLWATSALANAGVVLLLVSIGLWWGDRQTLKDHYGWIILAVLVGGLAVQLLKYGLDRPRPLQEFADLLRSGNVHIHVIGQALQHRSFPSGHTQVAAAVGTYLMYLHPRRWYWWSAGVLLVGLSRVYLGAHFPSDVLAGALLGCLCAVGVWHLRAKRIEDRG